MDSGNSSSMQSSSDADDEEYESRTESVPAFYDPSENYLNPFSQSQPHNSLPNFDGVKPLGNPQGSSSVQSRPLLKPEQRSVVKNPKKRTRASRTAPTRVLTTDTMNFRAIVQEFTGIPEPPFSGSSYSRRLDIFGSGSGMRSGHVESLGSPYNPLRPFAKRVKPADANITMNLQNQSHILSFQSLLHPPPLHPCLTLPGNFAVNSIDELGLSHGNATSNGLNDGNEDHLRPLDHWNYGGSTEQNLQRVHGCKLNYAASSTGYEHDKELENVSSRAQGRVDPWICPAE